MKNIVLYVTMILVVVLITISFSYDSVFASHDGSNPPEENIRTEPFRYYIIYVAMDRECSKYDQETLQFFRLLVPPYLHKYGFYYITEKAECINAKGHFVVGDDPTQYGLESLSEAVKRGEEWERDLTVIVFDNKLGALYSKAFEAGGHYYWKNYEHIVTTSTFGNKGESAWNALVLSEEVSHFVLRYFGYPYEIWGGEDTSYVHANRIKFLQCEENPDIYPDCSDTWTTITGRTGTFKVLAPYNKSIPKPTVSQVDPYESKATEIRLEVWNEYFEILTNIQNRQQEINSLKFESPNAKNNLQNAINTLSSATAYFDVVKHNLDVADNLFNRGLYEPAFNTYDNENDTLTSIKNLLFDISRTINSAKANENEYQEQKQLQEKTSTAEQSQYKLKVTNLGLYDNNRNLLSNPTINKVFSFRFEIENSGQNQETVKIYVPIRNDKGYLVTTMETTNAVVTSGQSIIVGTNYWKPDLVGKYVAIVAPAISSKDDTLIAPPFTIVFDIQTKNNDQSLSTSNFGKNPKEFCIEKGYTWYENECYASAQTVIDIQKLDEAKRELIKLKEKTINEIKDLETKTFSIEQILLGIEYADKNAQEKINEAWDRLKTNKQKLDFLNNRIIKGDDALNKNEIEIAENYYTRESGSICTINENLIKIPKLIDESKKLDKPKFCFLFWCW